MPTVLFHEYSRRMGRGSMRWCSLPQSHRKSIALTIVNDPFPKGVSPLWDENVYGKNLTGVRFFGQLGKNQTLGRLRYSVPTKRYLSNRPATGF